MPRPLLYYARHGETDWNREGRLQGQRDIPLNPTGLAQAVRSGEILRDLLGRDGRTPSQFDFVASPLSRARVTMERMRAAIGLSPDGYRIDDRLAEVAFGRWEGSTIAELASADPDAIAARERDKWAFVPPEGESYAAMTIRVGTWLDDVTEDSIVVAHGGVMRALMVLAGVARPETAPFADIDQGVIYVFADGKLARYA